MHRGGSLSPATAVPDSNGWCLLQVADPCGLAAVDGDEPHAVGHRAARSEWRRSREAAAGTGGLQQRPPGQEAGERSGDRVEEPPEGYEQCALHRPTSVVPGLGQGLGVSSASSMSSCMKTASESTTRTSSNSRAPYAAVSRKPKR